MDKISWGEKKRDGEGEEMGLHFVKKLCLSSYTLTKTWQGGRGQTKRVNDGRDEMYERGRAFLQRSLRGEVNSLTMK